MSHQRPLSRPYHVASHSFSSLARFDDERQKRYEKDFAASKSISSRTPHGVYPDLMTNAGFDVTKETIRNPTSVLPRFQPGFSFVPFFLAERPCF